MSKYFKVKATVEVEMDIYCSIDELDECIQDALEEGDYEIKKTDYDFEILDDHEREDQEYQERVLKDLTGEE